MGILYRSHSVALIDDLKSLEKPHDNAGGFYAEADKAYERVNI